MQVGAIGRTQDRAAARRDDPLLAVRASQLVDDSLFPIPESRLTVLLEKRTDRHADPLFEHRIGVDEASSNAFG